jgi:UDP:flavonoid glycosyltransferase YjiC (YdhE family)
VAAGHEVTFAVGEPFLDVLPVPTVHGLPVDVGLSDIKRETFRNHPGLAPGLEFAARMFGETATRHVEPVLRALFERERPDLVVYEVLNMGAALPATRQPIRPVAWAPPAPLPAWLPSSPRRRVYVTLGTVVFEAVEVLRRAVLATAEHDVDVLVAVGPAGDPALLGELPSNVHLEKFVPQAEVLRHVDLVVHHGGAGTTLGTLAAGLPQLILPQGADQPVNAMAIELAGAGRGMPNEAQTPEALVNAIGDLLADGPERVAAKRIADEIAGMPAPAAALLQPCS